MLESLKRIQTIQDFLGIGPVNIHEFSQEYFSHSEHFPAAHDFLSKINDIFFPISDLLALRVLTQPRQPYRLNPNSSIKLLEGECIIEEFTYEEVPTAYDWLAHLEVHSTNKQVLHSGDIIELPDRKNTYYILTAVTKCVMAHWNFQSRLISNLIEGYRFDHVRLSDKGRKLIKLSKNIYANDSKRSPDDLRVDFYQILEKMDEKDLFYIYFNQAYLIFRQQLSDFQQYFEKRFSNLKHE